MVCKLATFALLTWMFVLAQSGGVDNETAAGTPQEAAITKTVHGVPIYNYQWFHKHAKKSSHTKKGASANEEEVTLFTTWLVKAHDEADQKMRDFCALTELGKRHCTWTLSSMSSFHFNGTEDELTGFLNIHNGMVEFVEPDAVITLGKEELIDLGPEGGIHEDPIHDKPGVQQNPAEWGLDRIDDTYCTGNGYKPGLDGGYATGVHVFILDTGIRISHHEYEGRAVAEFDATSGSVQRCNPRDTSCAADRKSGHGSHCAGIVGGRKYGVAKKVRLHAGKVLSDEGSGGISGIVAGMDYVVSHGARPAIISMSLGGKGNGAYYKRAIDVAVQKGVTVVVAAGNEHSDACGFQPAFVPSAITVGSTVNPGSGQYCQYDQISYFSNYGRCVDIFAPGSDIKSVGRACDTCTAVMSGTSMACPAVAGATALVYGAYPGIQASKVKGLLKQHSSKLKAIIGQNRYPKPDSTHDFLYVGKKWIPSGMPAPTPTPSRPPSPSPSPTPTPKPTCRDANSECASWASLGLCNDPDVADYLKTECKKSCGVCSEVRACNPSACLGVTCKSGKCCAAGDWGCCGTKSQRKFCPAQGKLTQMCTSGACVKPGYKCNVKYPSKWCGKVCNPSTCMGLTCRNGKCCSYDDWDCCGTGQAKYTNRLYCPMMGDKKILCGNGLCTSDVNICKESGVVYGPTSCDFMKEMAQQKAAFYNSSRKDVGIFEMRANATFASISAMQAQLLQAEHQLEQADEQSVLAETPDREAGTSGMFLQVSIGIFAVVGIVMGVKWHKSMAREVQMQPYLG